LLIEKTIQAAREYNVKQVAVVGGVSANKALREAILTYRDEFDVVLPEWSYCTDNAAMIGAAAYSMIQNNRPFDTIELDGDVLSVIKNEKDM
jgi:N6-L-threonylcarbamoyladenine synthase